MAAQIRPEAIEEAWEDKEIGQEQMVSLLPILSEPLCELLGLEGWGITFHLEDMGERNDQGFGVHGDFTAEWSYRTAIIRINTELVKTLDAFVEVLLHEQLHLFFGPLAQLSMLESEMYEADPRSMAFIDRTARHFQETQVDDLRALLGARMRKIFGFGIKHWLMSLAITHLEVDYGYSITEEAPVGRADGSDSQHRRDRAEGAGAALRVPWRNERRNNHPGSGAGTPAARHRLSSWRRLPH